MSRNDLRTRLAEFCEACDGERPHEVRIEIRTESSSPDTAPFGKEPYRVTVCDDCGREEAVRASFG
jgi:hypothetical protein